MPLQHIENLLRRYKGQLVTIKMISGSIHQGRVTEITNDFVELIEQSEEQRDDETDRTFLLFQAIESVKVANLSASE